MRTAKKWLLVLCLAGPSVVNFSCTTMFMQTVRDAALDGTATFVEQATLSLLDQLLPPDDLAE